MTPQQPSLDVYGKRNRRGTSADPQHNHVGARGAYHRRQSWTEMKSPSYMCGRGGRRSMFTASWKVTESREVRVIIQISERSYLLSMMRRTEENGRKVMSLDTSEVETEL